MLLLAGAVALTTGLTTAQADVLRIAIVVADSPADYTNNVALVPTFGVLLRKGTGVKDVHVGIDPDHLTITSSLVWPDAAAIKSVTDTAEWKATVAKLKSKPFTPAVFQIVK